MYISGLYLVNQHCCVAMWIQIQRLSTIKVGLNIGPAFAGSAGPVPIYARYLMQALG